jgi:26S proteasome non-ATPase regulatory subunit 10
MLSSHRAATTGSVGFIGLLLDSSTPMNKIRLNPGDRLGKFYFNYKLKLQA